MDRAFAEHLVCTSAVLLAGVVLRVNLVEACLLVLCVGGVVTAEMFNTAIEQLAKTIDRQHNPQLGSALDLSAAAVLLASGSAALVGCIIFGYRLGIMLHWFSPVESY